MSRSKGVSKGKVAVGSNITYLTGTPVKDPSDVCDKGGLVLPSPRPWDFPPSIDGGISRVDNPMELDDPE
jgi:hypothetical protein